MNGIHEVTGSTPVWSTNPNSLFRSDSKTVLSGDDSHFLSSCTRVTRARLWSNARRIILSTSALECRQNPLTV